MSVENYLSCLNNIGNTCYMNSIIQLLNNIPELRLLAFNKTIKAKLKRRYKSKGDPKYLLTLEFLNLLEELNQKTTIVTPYDFKNQLGECFEDYDGFGQQDCCEFLLLLLDVLHTSLSYNVKITFDGKPKNKRDELYIKSLESWNSMFSKEYSDLVPLIFGQNKITMINERKKATNIFEPYNIITLSIIKCKNIYECFNKLLTREKITHNDYVEKYECLWRLPKYLIVNLKRFENGRKISHLVEYPLENLDLKKYTKSYVKTSCLYNLIAVSNHYGIMNMGHYMTYIKDEGQWYCMNDDESELIDNEDIIVNESAYILLYEKINIE